MKTFDLTNQEEVKNIYQKFDSFNTKKECYDYIGVRDNMSGIRYLERIANEIGFDLNIYAKRREEKKIKVCLHCGKKFIAKYKDKKFCCSSCAASHNNKLKPPRSEESKKKVSDSLNEYYVKIGRSRKYKPIKRVSSLNQNKNKKEKKKIKRQYIPKEPTIKKCPICGQEKCQRNEVCSHMKKFFDNLIWFGFDIKCLGTENIFHEFERIKEKLNYDYNTLLLSSIEIKEKYNYPKTSGNLRYLLKEIGVEVRSLSESEKVNILKGKTNPPIINLSNIKHGYHITWDGKKIYYRSSYELKYAELLDEMKVKYEVEPIRVEYYDTVRKINRIAIPDFLLIETKEIVEVKSKHTFLKQNMIDKFNQYEKMGYKPRLLYEGIMYSKEEMIDIEESKYVLGR